MCKKVKFLFLLLGIYFELLACHISFYLVNNKIQDIGRIKQHFLVFTTLGFIALKKKKTLAFVSHHSGLDSVMNVGIS